MIAIPLCVFLYLAESWTIQFQFQFQLIINETMEATNFDLIALHAPVILRDTLSGSESELGETSSNPILENDDAR